jgi:hypothetical protein
MVNRVGKLQIGDCIPSQFPGQPVHILDQPLVVRLPEKLTSRDPVTLIHPAITANYRYCTVLC